MADPVQSSNVNDFSKDADVLAAKIEMVKKQVDQLAGSLSSVNSQFTKFGKAAGKTYNPKINFNTGAVGGRPISSGNGTSIDREQTRRLKQEEMYRRLFVQIEERERKSEAAAAAKRQKEEERIYLATERWKRRQVQEEEKRQQQRADHLQRMANRRAKEQERLEKEAAKSAAKAARDSEKAQQKAEEEQKKERIKRINKIGFVLKTIGLAITAFAAAAHKWISNALENISNTRYNSNFDTLTKELQEADNATVKMNSTWKSFTKAFTAGFSGIISGLGSALQWLIDKFADFFSFLMGESNGSEKYQAAVDAQTRAEKVGYVQSALRGRGFSGKATTAMSKNAVQYALQRMRNSGGYEGLTDTQLLNHDDFDQWLNEGLDHGKTSTLLTGYIAEKYGRAYAMVDRTPEENARLYNNMMSELSAPGITNEKYNDMIKQWTKTGRIIEKFGKNLYSFDEVLSNDPFSNEEITDINDATGGIEDGVDQGNNTLEASYHTLEDVLEAYKKGDITLEEALAAIKANGIDTTKFIDDFIEKLKLTAPFTSKGIDKLSQNQLLKLALEDLKLALTPSNITGKVSPGQGFINTLGNVWEATTHDEHGNKVSKITGNTLPTSEFEKQDYFGKTVYNASLDDAQDVLDNTVEYFDLVASTFKKLGNTSGLNSETAVEWYKIILNFKNTYKNWDLASRSKALGGNNEAIKELYDVIGIDIGTAKNYLGGWLESMMEYYELYGNPEDKDTTLAAFKLIGGYSNFEDIDDAYENIMHSLTKDDQIIDLTGENKQTTWSLYDLLDTYGRGHKFATGGLATRKMPTLSTLFEEGPEMVLPLNAAGADFLATSLNNLGLSNRLTNNSANVNVNLSGINIADNDREWYEVAHKIHNIIEAEQARQGG